MIDPGKVTGHIQERLILGNHVHKKGLNALFRELLRDALVQPGIEYHVGAAQQGHADIVCLTELIRVQGLEIPLPLPEPVVRQPVALVHTIE